MVLCGLLLPPPTPSSGRPYSAKRRTNLAAGLSLVAIHAVRSPSRLDSAPPWVLGLAPVAVAVAVAARPPLVVRPNWSSAVGPDPTEPKETRKSKTKEEFFSGVLDKRRGLRHG